MYGLQLSHCRQPYHTRQYLDNKENKGVMIDEVDVTITAVAMRTTRGHISTEGVDVTSGGGHLFNPV